jgi:hypothetical protein
MQNLRPASVYGGKLREGMMSEYTIYVSHTLEDSATADRLKGELTSAGFAVSLNIHTVPAGSRPKPVLKEAMARSVRFLACFSSRYGAPTEYEQDEVSWAIEHSAGRPAGETWLIPVKLTACDIPPLQMTEGNLSELAAVELRDWAVGVARLLASLPIRAQVAETAKSPVSADEPKSRFTHKARTFTAAELEAINHAGPQATEMVLDLDEVSIVGKATFVNNKP